jgi:nucleoside-diphosphate-sugar epimerase
VGARRCALEVLVTSPAWPALSGAGARRLAESDARVIVTGASGWLGLATLEMLHALMGEAFSRRVVCLGGRARRLSVRGGVEVDQAPISAIAELAPAPSIVLHLGFLTQGPQMTLGAEDYVAANDAIRRTVLSALDRVGAEALFLASSGAAYLADRCGGPQSKQLYGWLKREDEVAFGAWGRERGKTVAIARIFNLTGPYINRRATYAIACFIADALARRLIRIQAPRPVYRSYTSIAALMSSALGALTDAPHGPFTFDTSGEAVLEMAEIANAVASALQAREGVRRPSFDPAAEPDRYVGDGAAYAALSERFGVAPTLLADQIRQTADFMAEHPEAA